MDILVLIVQLLKAHRPVTKPLRNLILLIVFSYLNVTAQVNSKLSGHFGVSTVYQPPFQILYVPVGLDLIEFNPVIKLRVNSELEYEIGSKGEIIMGIGLGNAGLQANGVSLDPNAIEQIDREFDLESLVAFNSEQYDLLNTSFEHVFATLGGFYFFGRSSKSLALGVRGYLPYYLNFEPIGRWSSAAYEDVAVVYKANFKTYFFLEVILKKQVVILNQKAQVSLSAIYGPNDAFVGAWSQMATNRVNSFNTSDYPFPVWNYGLTLSYPLF